METALNTPKVSFEDFYEVPNLKFDIDRLRKDLEIILKEKKFNTPGVTPVSYTHLTLPTSYAV